MTSVSPKQIRRVLVAADGRVKMQDPGGYHALPTDDPDPGAAEKASQRVRPHKESRGTQFPDAPLFQCCAALLIIANAVVIGLETQSPDWKLLLVVENVFLLCFVLELLIRMLFLGPVAMFSIYHHDFGWNTFDVLVVGAGVAQQFQHSSDSGIVEFILAKMHGRSSGSFITIFRTIRLLRILRGFRIVKSLKQLYLLAFSLAEATKAVLWVAMMTLFALYVCSIVLVKTVGQPTKADAQSPFFTNHFGSITESMLTLFVLMSSNLSSYQDEMSFWEEKPFFCLCIVALITFGSFGILAMLIGLVTESVLEKNEMRKQEARLEHEEMRLSLGDRSKQLFQTLLLDANGEATVEDVIALAPQMSSTLEAAGANVAQYDMVELIEDMDTDGRRTINAIDFMQTMQKIAEGLSPLSIQEVHHEVTALHKSYMNSSQKLHDVQHSVNYMMKVMQRLVDQSESSHKGVEDVQQSVNYIEAHLQRAPKPLELVASVARLQDLQDSVSEMRVLVIEKLVDQAESNCELRRSINDMTMMVHKLADQSESNCEAEAQSPQWSKTDPSDFAAGPSASSADLVETTLARMAEMLSKSSLATPALAKDHSEGLAASLLASITEVISKQTAAIQDEVAQQCKELAASQERTLHSLRIPQQSIEGREVSAAALLCGDAVEGVSQGAKPLDESTASALGSELCDFSRESTEWIAQSKSPSGGGRTRHAERHLDRLLDKMTKVSRQKPRPGQTVVDENSTEQKGDAAPSPEVVSLDAIKREHVGEDPKVVRWDTTRQEDVVEEQGRDLASPCQPLLQETNAVEFAKGGLTAAEQEKEVAMECDSGYREGERLPEFSLGNESPADNSMIAEPSAQQNSQED